MKTQMELTLDRAREVLKTAIGCPWCGTHPIPETKSFGLRDEPQRYVALVCPKCDARREVVVTESDELQVHATGKSKRYASYGQGCTAVCLPRLVELWNTRVVQ